MIDITLAKDIPHRTTITDNGVEYWTVIAITQHIGVAKSTFASYVARGQAPRPYDDDHRPTLRESEAQ